MFLSGRSAWLMAGLLMLAGCGPAGEEKKASGQQQKSTQQQKQSVDTIEDFTDTVSVKDTLTKRQKQPASSSATSTSVEVSKNELKEFARIGEVLQTLQSRASQRIMNEVKQSGLGMTRYREMARKQEQSPNGNALKNFSDQERSRFRKAHKKIRKIQEETQQQMEQRIRQEGMKVERFEAISAAIKEDKLLREKFRNIQSRQTLKKHQKQHQ